MRYAAVLLLSVALLPLGRVLADEKSDEAAAVAKVEALGGSVERKSARSSAATGRTGSPPEQGNRASQAPTYEPIVAVSFIGNETLKDEDLQCLRSFPELRELSLGRTRISDAGLKHIAGLSNLRRLGLVGTKITDAGLKELEGLHELRHLLVGETAITDAGMTEIGKLKRLQSLTIWMTPISDAGVKKLESLPNLMHLNLDQTKITDAALAEMSRFPSLWDLSLIGTAISDAGLQELAKLQHLRGLDLSQTKITDAGLKELGTMQNLVALDLNMTQITDAGLQRLAGMKKLRRLFVVGTKVTDAGTKGLNKLLPLVRVLRQYAGQRADPDFDVSVPHPAYADKHPTVLFDEAHKNFHTATGRYKVFADLITNDGYRVTPNRELFTPELLEKYDLLVSANAPAKSGQSRSAFTKSECDSVENWVRAGGGLLLITDHEPFGAGSQELGKRFGVNMGLLFTTDPTNETKGDLLFSREKNQLGDHAIMRGRNESEQVNRVLTFTGQSLAGPPGSIQLLKFADTAMDVGRGKRISAAGRAQGIALKFGKGRVVVMGEAAELSAQVYGDPPEKMGMNALGCDNRKMALNIVHWLSGLID